MGSLLVYVEQEGCLKAVGVEVAGLALALSLWIKMIHPPYLALQTRNLDYFFIHELGFVFLNALLCELYFAR